MKGMWSRALAVSLLTAGAVGGVSGAAWATPSPPTPIAIVNPSFEANNPGNTSGIGYSGTQDYSAIGATGWGTTGGRISGWWHPSTVEYPGGGSTSVAATNIPDGAQIAFVNGGSGLGQTLSTGFAADAQYTLSFSVGWRAGGIQLPTSYTVELMAGATVLDSVLNPGRAGLTAGQFQSASFSYTSPYPDALAGQPLGILLLASGSSGTQVNFDNFSLSVINTVNPIPEPWAVALLSVGLFGMLAARQIPAGRRR